MSCLAWIRVACPGASVAAKGEPWETQRYCGNCHILRPLPGAECRMHGGGVEFATVTTHGEVRLDCRWKAVACHTPCRGARLVCMPATRPLGRPASRPEVCQSGLYFVVSLRHVRPMATGHTHQTDVAHHRRRPGRPVRRVRMRHAEDALPRRRRARRCRRPMRRALSGKADLRHPGLPPIEAAELIEQLEAQAAPFRPVYHLGQQVESLEPLSGGSGCSTTSTGTVVHARAVIIAAGVGAFGPNRPPLDGHRGLRGQERLLLRDAARGFPRQARGHRRRRRLRGRLGAVAGRDRRPRLGGAPPRQVPRRARERGAAGGAGQGGQDRAGGALPAARAGRRRRPAHGRDGAPRWKARPSGSRPTRCCPSSACR